MVRPVFVVIVETRTSNDSCIAMERGNEGIETEETTHELVLLKQCYMQPARSFVITDSNSSGWRVKVPSWPAESNTTCQTLRGFLRVNNDYKLPVCQILAIKKEAVLYNALTSHNSLTHETPTMKEK
jgi:hypothetical protein